MFLSNVIGEPQSIGNQLCGAAINAPHDGTAALRLVTAPLLPFGDRVMQWRVKTFAAFRAAERSAAPDLGTRTLARAHCDIAFNGVTLRYPGAERPALDGLTLTVRAGTTVALVGSSGAGKTTLVNTLHGFGALDDGTLTLDGIAVHELRKSDLRRQFAVVSQDIVLFDASIADNVVYAQPRDLARVEACLRAAALWAHVASLPAGIETPIGVNGSKLSSGQRQRLAIARALYKDAPVWILDEATSALDTESERAIQQALEQMHGHKTMLVIAHGLSTISNADIICVLDGGRAVETGDHRTLLAQGGRYAAMVAAQQADLGPFHQRPRSRASAYSNHSRQVCPLLMPTLRRLPSVWLR